MHNTIQTHSASGTTAPKSDSVRAIGRTADAYIFAAVFQQMHSSHAGASLVDPAVAVSGPVLSDTGPATPSLAADDLIVPAKVPLDATTHPHSIASVHLHMMAHLPAGIPTLQETAAPETKLSEGAQEPKSGRVATTVEASDDEPFDHNSSDPSSPTISPQLTEVSLLIGSKIPIPDGIVRTGSDVAHGASLQSDNRLRPVEAEARSGQRDITPTAPVKIPFQPEVNLHRSATGPGKVDVSNVAVPTATANASLEVASGQLPRDASWALAPNAIAAPDPGSLGVAASAPKTTQAGTPPPSEPPTVAIKLTAARSGALSAENPLRNRQPDAPATEPRSLTAHAEPADDPKGKTPSVAPVLAREPASIANLNLSSQAVSSDPKTEGAAPATFGRSPGKPQIARDGGVEMQAVLAIPGGTSSMVRTAMKPEHSAELAAVIPPAPVALVANPVNPPSSPGTEVADDGTAGSIVPSSVPLSVDSAPAFLIGPGSDNAKLKAMPPASGTGVSIDGPTPRDATRMKVQLARTLTEPPATAPKQASIALPRPKSGDAGPIPRASYMPLTPAESVPRKGIGSNSAALRAEIGPSQTALNPNAQKEPVALARAAPVTADGSEATLQSAIGSAPTATRPASLEGVQVAIVTQNQAKPDAKPAMEQSQSDMPWPVPADQGILASKITATGKLPSDVQWRPVRPAGLPTSVTPQSRTPVGAPWPKTPVETRAGEIVKAVSTLPDQTVSPLNVQDFGTSALNSGPTRLPEPPDLTLTPEASPSTGPFAVTHPESQLSPAPASDPAFSRFRVMLDDATPIQLAANNLQILVDAEPSTTPEPVDPASLISPLTVADDPRARSQRPVSVSRLSDTPASRQAQIVPPPAVASFGRPLSYPKAAGSASSSSSLPVQGTASDFLSQPTASSHLVSASPQPVLKQDNAPSSTQAQQSLPVQPPVLSASDVQAATAGPQSILPPDLPFLARSVGPTPSSHPEALLKPDRDVSNVIPASSAAVASQRVIANSGSKAMPLLPLPAAKGEQSEPTTNLNLPSGNVSRAPVEQRLKVPHPPTQTPPAHIQTAHTKVAQLQSDPSQEASRKADGIAQVSKGLHAANEPEQNRAEIGVNLAGQTSAWAHAAAPASLISPIAPASAMQIQPSRSAEVAQMAVSAGPYRTSHPLPKAFSTALARSVTESGHSRAELILEPAELGKLRFDLVTRGTEVQVTLAAERPETLTLLRNHADELRQEFRAAGLDTGSLNFSQWGQRDDGQTLPNSAAAEPVRDEPDATPMTTTLSPLPRNPGAGLDLRL